MYGGSHERIAAGNHPGRGEDAYSAGPHIDEAEELNFERHTAAAERGGFGSSTIHN